VNDPAFPRRGGRSSARHFSQKMIATTSPLMACWYSACAIISPATGAYLPADWPWGAANHLVLIPTSGGWRPYVGACGIGIDGGGGELGVSEPFLDEVRGRRRTRRSRGVAPWARSCGQIALGRCHDGLHSAPDGHARPAPEVAATALATARAWQLADALHEVERRAF
jgi:hypothetical protein